jgi:glycerol uptake facilitator-like aquaporin
VREHTAVAGIALSPLGRRSGAHLNPAVTLVFGDVGHLWIYLAAPSAAALALGALWRRV